MELRVELSKEENDFLQGPLNSYKGIGRKYFLGFEDEKEKHKI